MLSLPSLSQADAALVRRDPDLPGLATLFDPAAFARLLQSACPDVAIQQAVATYVRYKPATNCLVSYTVTTALGPCTVYGIAFRYDERAKLAKAQEKKGHDSLLGFGTFVHQDLQLVLYTFPNDRRLPSLWRITDATKRQRLFQALGWMQGDLAESTLVALRYKPERRYVARLESTQAKALLRLYTKDEFAIVSANHQAFQSNPYFCVPPLLGIAAEDQALLLGWLSGESLENRLQESANLRREWQAIGKALATLHTQRPVLPIHYRTNDETTALHAAASAVAQLAPELSLRATQLAALLARSLAATPYPVTAIHGDFSVDQVLFLDKTPIDLYRGCDENRSFPLDITGEQNSGFHTEQCIDDACTAVAILDFDRAGYGDPAADLGSFAANLQQRVLQSQGTTRPLTDEPVALAMTALLDGYTQKATQPVDPYKVQLHTAVRLLRLTPEPFRQRWSPDWPHTMTLLLQKAEEIAGYA